MQERIQAETEFIKEQLAIDTALPLFFVTNMEQARHLNALFNPAGDIIEIAAPLPYMNPAKLKDIIEETPPKRTIIFTDPESTIKALDGTKQQQREYFESLLNELPEKEQPKRAYYNLYKWDITEKEDDYYFNEVNQQRPKELTSALHEILEKTIPEAGTVAQYIDKTLFPDIKEMQAQAWRKTGFKEWDEKAGAIYSGLYIIGGGTSAGKTTFITQLAEQMAENGSQILFFSMEQSQLEIVTKGIARRYAQLFPKGPKKTSLDIRTEEPTEETQKAIAAYKQAVGDRLHIIEGNFDCTVSKIKREIEQHIALKRERPVVFIDYLQVLRPDIDPDTGRKPTDQRQIAEYNVTEIKRISRQYKTPVFLVSSLNRDSYLEPITEKSFKETGGIEYTADVLMALQLKILTEECYQKTKAAETAKRSEMVKEENNKNPRKLELTVIKNRYGAKYYTVDFEYTTTADTFKDKYAANFKELKDMPEQPEEMAFI